MNLDDFIKYSLSILGFSSVVIFIARTIFIKIFDFARDRYKSSLDKDLENYKYTLLLEAERYKTELNIAFAEQNIRFSKLHETRAKVIEELYMKLLELRSMVERLELQSVIGNVESLKRAENEVFQFMFDFRDYFDKIEIYIPSEVCSFINDLIIHSIGSLTDVMKVSNLNKEERLSLLANKTVQERHEHDITKLKVSEVLKKLKHSFRTLLGDTTTDTEPQKTPLSAEEKLRLEKVKKELDLKIAQVMGETKIS
jgi:hypothetical protein